MFCIINLVTKKRLRIPGDKLDDPAAGLEAEIRVASDIQARAAHLRHLLATVNVTSIRAKSKEWSGNKKLENA